jgi:hypothetical protein
MTKIIVATHNFTDCLKISVRIKKKYYSRYSNPVPLEAVTPP